MDEPLRDNNDGVGSIVDELERLAKLRDQGDITEDDYRTLKARIIEGWAKSTTDSPDQKMVAATDDPYGQLPTSIWTSGLGDRRSGVQISPARQTVCRSGGVS